MKKTRMEALGAIHRSMTWAGWEKGSSRKCFNPEAKRDCEK